MVHESLFKKVAWRSTNYGLGFTGVNIVMFAQELHYFSSLNPSVERKNDPV